MTETAELSFVRRHVFSTDHKVIGKQFLFTAMGFFTIGGLLAILMRTQLAWPWQEIPIIGPLLYGEASGNILPPESYPALVTMHGTIMIFFFIIPILSGALGNFLIPLMTGARDMAFPRLNLASYWLMVPAFLLVLSSFLVTTGPASAGWTSYAPLSILQDAAPGSAMGQTLWVLSLMLVGTSSLVGAINYITTIVMLRAPGLDMFRLPMTIWALFITAILVTFATPVLTAALILMFFDRSLGTLFFAAGEGQVILWQHLFWFYSHPAVYIMILPAMGVASDVISTFSRKPLFGYKPMVYSIWAIAGLGFIVWGHHMFVSGMNPLLGITFMTSTMLIAIPSAVKTFNWLGTLWRGNLQLQAPMLNALAFVSTFVIGGLSGIYSAATPVDIFLHDTYWIVGHIHYVLFGGSLFGVFAGVQYWFPKMFGRMMSNTAGVYHFVITFVTFNMIFLPMFYLGAFGMPRRIADPYQYEMFSGLQGTNQFMTYSLFVLAAAQLLFAGNFFCSLFRGRVAGKNPWKANTLEWTTDSPPPHENFEEIPTVYRGPYEYSSPLVAADYLPQDQYVDGAKPPELIPEPVVSPAAGD